jgi:hypothetical protein
MKGALRKMMTAVPAIYQNVSGTHRKALRDLSLAGLF